MIPKYFDIHSHIHDREFDHDRKAVIERTLGNNIWTITVGTDRRSSQLATQLSKFYKNLFVSIGIHPTDDTDMTRGNFNEEYFSELVVQPEVVAIGECGLDYFRSKNESNDEKERQRNLFEAQLEFAVEHKLPLMIHCRNAHDDMIDILSSKKKEHGDALRGNIHFFTADTQMAGKYFDLDFTVSFSGVITFTHDYDEVVAYAPVDRIMSETDCPYVAPVPYRGKRNEPLYVSEVADRIAEIRGGDTEETKKALVANALRIFNIKG